MEEAIHQRHDGGLFVGGATTALLRRTARDRSRVRAALDNRISHAAGSVIRDGGDRGVPRDVIESRAYGPATRPRTSWAARTAHVRERTPSTRGQATGHSPHPPPKLFTSTKNMLRNIELEYHRLAIVHIQYLLSFVVSKKKIDDFLRLKTLLNASHVRFLGYNKGPEVYALKTHKTRIHSCEKYTLKFVYTNEQVKKKQFLVL